MKTAHDMAGLNRSGSRLKTKRQGVAKAVLIAAMLSVPTLVAAEEPGSLGWDEEADIKSIVQQQSDAEIYQVVIPDRNTALTTQIGSQNNARIQQGNGSSGYPNLAAIYQRGNGNDANIDQQGGLNVGIVSQVGNQLEANLIQTGGQFEAVINQHGVNGQVNLSQSGSGYRVITIDQLARSGAGATATIVTN